MLVLQHVLFNSWREKWMTWVTWSQAIRLSEGRGQSSCRHLQLPGSSEQPKAEDTNTLHITEEISTFHQKEVSSWMAYDKSCYWVISDFFFFFSKNGGNSENWLRAFIIYISFPVLYSEQKVRFLRFWWQEEVICKFVNLDAKCSHLNHKKGSRREHTVFSLTQILSLFFL